MNIEVTRINSGIRKSPQEYIKSVNEDYLFRLGKIADDIVASRDEKPVILLAGPSGSGKTTTAMMLAKMLEERGSKTHTLSMDNYFCSLTEEEKSLSALGKIDLESPLRVDKEFLNRQIEEISSARKSSFRNIISKPLQEKVRDVNLFVSAASWLFSRESTLLIRTL